MLTATKERSIRILRHEVAGILDGRQTQIRRVVKPAPPDGWDPGPVEEYFPAVEDRNGMLTAASKSIFGAYDDEYGIACPFGRPGDLLWGQEAWTSKCGVVGEDHRACIRYREGYDFMDGILKWRQSPRMPRWASRIILEITSVRVERLQDISEADAIANGAQCAGVPADLTNRGAFGKMWNKVNGAGAWGANPWVWALSFRRIV